MPELRDDGKYNDNCPVCGQKVVVTRVFGTTTAGDLQTTPAEDHSPVCRSKVMLSRRPQYIPRG